MLTTKILVEQPNHKTNEILLISRWAPIINNNHLLPRDRMLHAHNELPLFVYGTLRDDRKYSDDVNRYNPIIERDVFCYGNLYYNNFIDENEKECITAALDPNGVQRVSGQLFHFHQRYYYHMLINFDEKEFNFENLSDTSVNNLRRKVYVRSVVNCISGRTGKITQAYAYILIPKEYPLFCYPLINDDISFDACTEYPEEKDIISVDDFKIKLNENLTKYGYYQEKWNRTQQEDA